MNELVYIIIYENPFTEEWKIIGVYNNEEVAQQKVIKLNTENREYRTNYFVEEWNIQN